MTKYSESNHCVENTNLLYFSKPQKDTNNNIKVKIKNVVQWL